jgi:hypothetical protein
LNGVALVTIAVRVPVPAFEAFINKKLPPEVDLNDVIDAGVNQYLYKSAYVADAGIVFVTSQFNEPVVALLVITQSLGKLKFDDHIVL